MKLKNIITHTENILAKLYTYRYVTLQSEPTINILLKQIQREEFRYFLFTIKFKLKKKKL